MAFSSALFDVSPASESSQHDDTLACRRCGSLGEHHEQPGIGPHRAKLVCSDCGAFLRWLPTHPPAVRAARTKHYRRAHMATLPPTELQLAYLQKLGDSTPAPMNRLEASERINALRET